MGQGRQLRLLLLLLLAGLVPFLESCATVPHAQGQNRAGPIRHATGFPAYYIAFEEHRYADAHQEVVTAARERLFDVEARNHVFYNVLAGSAALYAGNLKAADEHFARGTHVVDSTIGQGLGVVSTAMWESARYFRGEAYERMALYLYRGIIHFQAGNMGNARASFQNALRVDLSASEPDFQEDNALAWYMLALTYVNLGELDNARIAVGKAHEEFPHNPCFDFERIQQDNLVILLETGEGPFKRKDRRNESMSRILSREGPARNADVYINTYHVGQTYLALDNYYQAVTHGLRGRHLVQAAKGGIQNIVDNPAVGFLLGHADIRSWRFLPHAQWVHCSYLDPGAHHVTMVFESPGEDLRAYRETHHFVPVPAEGQGLLFLRNQPGVNHAKPNLPGAMVNCVEATCPPDAQPFLLGGNDYSPPTPENVVRWQGAGHFEGLSLMEIHRAYRDQGYQWWPNELPCNCQCRETPHAALGGTCLETPLPGTDLNERVHLGR